MTRAELDQIWYTVIFALKGEFHQRGWLPPALTTASDADERAKELATLRGEPVAWRFRGFAESRWQFSDYKPYPGWKFIEPLYAAPDWIAEIRAATLNFPSAPSPSPQPVTKASHDVA